MLGPWVWNITTIDIAFHLTVILVFLYVVQRLVSASTRARRWKWVKRLSGKWKLDIAILVALGGLLGTYLAYGTFRNQMRQTAEAASNEDAAFIVQWEREKPHIRCLYGWYSNIIDPEKCLDEIVSSPEKFSEALLYIEEVVFLLETSARNEKIYRSPYFEDIGYWREDIEEDPTGLFAFHLVNRYPIDEVQKEAAKTGICIPDLCIGYERVRLALGARGFTVDSPHICRFSVPRAKLRTTCKEP